KSDSPQKPAIDPVMVEIQNHRTEIEKRMPALENSRDPLLSRFSSLLAGAATMPVAESKTKLAELDALSKDLAEVVEKEYAAADRGYFHQQAGVFAETKNKPTVGVEDFQRWMKEVKEPQYVRLDEKLDPRKSW